MANIRRVNLVHRSLSRPLTILGAERKLFFFAMCLGVLTFLLLFFLAQWATRTDPQILRFLLSAARLRTQYDPAKFGPVAIRKVTDA
jgi:type IV secretory pathway TrbD component